MNHYKSNRLMWWWSTALGPVIKKSSGIADPYSGGIRSDRLRKSVKIAQFAQLIVLVAQRHKKRPPNGGLENTCAWVYFLACLVLASQAMTTGLATKMEE